MKEIQFPIRDNNFETSLPLSLFEIVSGRTIQFSERRSPNEKNETASALHPATMDLADHSTNIPLSNDNALQPPTLIQDNDIDTDSSHFSTVQDQEPHPNSEAASLDVPVSCAVVEPYENPKVDEIVAEKRTMATQAIPQTVPVNGKNSSSKPHFKIEWFIIYAGALIMGCIALISFVHNKITSRDPIPADSNSDQQEYYPVITDGISKDGITEDVGSGKKPSNPSKKEESESQDAFVSPSETRPWHHATDNQNSDEQDSLTIITEDSTERFMLSEQASSSTKTIIIPNMYSETAPASSEDKLSLSKAADWCLRRKSESPVIYSQRSYCRQLFLSDPNVDIYCSAYSTKDESMNPISQTTHDETDKQYMLTNEETLGNGTIYTIYDKESEKEAGLLYREEMDIADIGGNNQKDTVYFVVSAFYNDEENTNTNQSYHFWIEENHQLYQIISIES